MNNKQRTTTNAHPPSAETSINQKGTIMQNKPNLPNVQINVSSVLTKDYQNESRLRTPGKQTQTNPIYPYRRGIKPNLVRRLVHRSFSEDGSISEGGFKRDTLLLCGALLRAGLLRTFDLENVYPERSRKGLRKIIFDT